MRATSATVGNGVSMIVGFDMNRAYSFGTTRSTEANPLANRSVVESRSDGTAVKHNARSSIGGDYAKASTGLTARG